jgi:hypothetical protein
MTRPSRHGQGDDAAGKVQPPQVHRFGPAREDGHGDGLDNIPITRTHCGIQHYSGLRSKMNAAPL